MFLFFSFQKRSSGTYLNLKETTIQTLWKINFLTISLFNLNKIPFATYCQVCVFFLMRGSFFPRPTVPWFFHSSKYFLCIFQLLLLTLWKHAGGWVAPALDAYETLQHSSTTDWWNIISLNHATSWEKIQIYRAKIITRNSKLTRAANKAADRTGLIFSEIVNKKWFSECPLL